MLTACGRAGMAAKPALAPAAPRGAAGQGKIFVPFVVQFWLRPKPRATIKAFNCFAQNSFAFFETPSDRHHWF